MHCKRVCIASQIISAITRNTNQSHEHSNEWHDLSSVVNREPPWYTIEGHSESFRTITYSKRYIEQLRIIEQLFRLKHKKPDWIKDKTRRYSLRYGPAPNHNRLQYLSVPKEPSTDLRYAILTELTWCMPYRTSHSVGKAFSRATNVQSLMSLTQIFPDHEDATRIKYSTSNTCAEHRSASTITAILPHPLWLSIH